jgi:hypothetical protein
LGLGETLGESHGVNILQNRCEAEWGAAADGGNACHVDSGVTPTY